MLNLLRRMWSPVSQLGSGCLGCLTSADKEELAALGAVWTVVVTHPPVIPVEGLPVGSFSLLSLAYTLGKSSTSESVTTDSLIFRSFGVFTCQLGMMAVGTPKDCCEESVSHRR